MNGSIYEQAAVRGVLGDTLRPGGLSLTKRALEICGLPKGARVLDVGCGTGATVQSLRECGFAASGADLSAALLQAHRQRSSDGFLMRADAAHLPLAAGRLDAVLAECSLSIFAEADLALAEFCRLLARDGYLILSDVYFRNPSGPEALPSFPPAWCLRGALCRTELLTRLARTGFEVMIWEDHSEVLRHLAGQMMTATGALDQVLNAGTSGGLAALDWQLAVARARPGYYLLVAKKADH